MTKKNFIALADFIKDYEKYNEPRFTTQQIDVFVRFCASQNPQFNRERFLAYIAGTNGKNGGKV